MLDARHTPGTTVPALLTVEEAGAVLRVGRTKAYAMARRWRTSGGVEGLPVIDLGSVLRVPRHRLEDLIGEPIESIPEGHGDDDPEPSATEAPARPPTTTRRPSRRRGVDDQLALFDSDPAS